MQLWDGILLVTQVTQLDGVRAQQLTETLRSEVTRRRAKIVILDITGLQRGLQLAMDKIGLVVQNKR